MEKNLFKNITINHPELGNGISIDVDMPPLQKGGNKINILFVNCKINDENKMKILRVNFFSKKQFEGSIDWSECKEEFKNEIKIKLFNLTQIFKKAIGE